MAGAFYGSLAAVAFGALGVSTGVRSRMPVAALVSALVTVTALYLVVFIATYEGFASDA